MNKPNFGKTFLKITAGMLGVYIAICMLLYFLQEKLIFFPQKVNADYKFEFAQPTEEINIKMEDGIILNSLLFKADSAKGLIFYLHGNGGSIKAWGDVCGAYTDLNYDVLMMDYRGYGKSESHIKSEEQFYDDVQTVYDYIKPKYGEQNIIILGYSIGTGPAAKLASENNAKMLVLQAPYYSLTDMMHEKYPPVLPNFLLKYKFRTDEFISRCKMPVVIFHGNADEVIPYESSLKLKERFKDSDMLITLPGQGHNGMTQNESYLAQLKYLLK